MTERKITRVAAGILLQSDGQFLLGSRPQGKPYAGYWEFPGGKIEAGETPVEALARELHEELGIELTAATPWLCQRFDYPHALVELYFFRVTAWKGELVAHEGQQFGWQQVGQLTASPILPANGPILRGLAMGDHLLFSPGGRIDDNEFLAQLTQYWQQSAAWLVLREPQLSDEAYCELCRKAAQIARPHGGKLIAHGAIERAAGLNVDGVHLSSQQLMSLTERPRGFDWVGASTHNEAQLKQVQVLALDYSVLGHVAESASHPHQAPMGWAQFTALLAKGWSSPCFAIGGQSLDSLTQAQQAGAQGVAILGAAWK